MKPKKPANKNARTRDQAVALQYNQTERLPRVLASGTGEVARHILRLAEEHHVPIKQNEPLAEMLSKLDAGAVIPPETYGLVAEIISFLFHTDEEWRKKHSFLEGTMKGDALASS